jgi:hypothetical protein
VAMDPGVHFTGRCTMLESGSDGVELGQSHRSRDLVRS